MLRNLRRQTVLILSAVLILAASDAAQKQNKGKHKADQAEIGAAIMWQRVNIASRDLFTGPGGDSMKPDLSGITFIEREKGGHNKKYRIKDGSGRIWVAKPFTEARPETAAVRLLWGLGYETEINYLVPELTIPGVGTFKNVRLEARPGGVKRLDTWKWRDNPFIGTNEFQGLKILQIFLNNNDVIDYNNKILSVDGPNGPEFHYIISDLGSTFGKRGNNNLPLFYRFGRKNDSPPKWSRSSFIKGVKNGRIVFATTGMKNRGLYKDITLDQGRWLYELLRQLSQDQISDMFRAANYSPQEIETLTAAFRTRVSELDEATANIDRIANRPAKRTPTKTRVARTRRH
ncbi:MAG TPA: hypothetical protein VEV84_13625 [Pyrinomonadaceae bacterium]|nr:hypothetical protein [Pyrinomonadaceae bacterium]